METISTIGNNISSGSKRLATNTAGLFKKKEAATEGDAGSEAASKEEDSEMRQRSASEGKAAKMSLSASFGARWNKASSSLQEGIKKVGTKLTTKKGEAAAETPAAEVADAPPSPPAEKPQAVASQSWNADPWG